MSDQLQGKSNNTLAIVLIVVIIILTGAVGFLVYGRSKTDSIDTYERCVAAGYPVRESYPAVCAVPNGKSFTQPIEPGGGEEVACTMDARICPDGSAVGRIAPDCEFAACPID